MDTAWIALITLSLSAYAVLVYSVSLDDYENVYVVSVLLLTMVLCGLIATAIRPLLARIALFRSDYVLKCDPSDNCTVSLIAPGTVSGAPVQNTTNGVLDISLTMLTSCSAFFASRIREKKESQAEQASLSLKRSVLYSITLASWLPTMMVAVDAIHQSKDSASSMAFAMALGSLVGTASQVIVGNADTYEILRSR